MVRGGALVVEELVKRPREMLENWSGNGAANGLYFPNSISVELIVDL
jgi:hypothetical protein